jgi:hypothetical protein
MRDEQTMSATVQPTYDDMLPSDLATLQAVDSHHTLALWHRRLCSWGWPEELAPDPNPSGDPIVQSHEEWKATAPDRRDDIMEWIKNKVGSKYLLMVWQCELMMRFIPGVPHPSEADFEKWWNEPYPGDPSITKGENHLRSAAWWAKTREEWRATRKARLAQKISPHESLER